MIDLMIEDLNRLGRKRALVLLGCMVVCGLIVIAAV